MNIVISANLFDTLSALTAACDLVDYHVRNHSERVAYLAVQIGSAYGLERQSLEKLARASLLHDIGVATTQEKIYLADLNPNKDIISLHCERGFELLLNTSLFSDLAKYVLHHHDYYHDDLHIIPAIIHLADRVEILLKKDQYCLWQVDAIIEQIRAGRGSIFHPQIVDCFLKIARVPSLWLDLEHGTYLKLLRDEINFERQITLSELRQIAELFAIIVDSKSPFTTTHSSGLAVKIDLLTEKLNMDQALRESMYIAALLHDIGKLAVPEDIITFPGKLSKQQMQVMQQHTYHTYYLIGKCGQGIEKIQQWAAYHHERLDGSGYPFCLKASQLDQNSRLMAIVDVAQAIMEDRPYRPGMPNHRIIQVLRDEVKLNRLDGDLVDFVIDNLDLISNPSQIA